MLFFVKIQLALQTSSISSFESLIFALSIS
jgi:hypothetical protein